MRTSRSTAVMVLVGACLFGAGEARGQDLIHDLGGGAWYGLGLSFHQVDDPDLAFVQGYRLTSALTPTWAVGAEYGHWYAAEFCFWTPCRSDRGQVLQLVVERRFRPGAILRPVVTLTAGGVHWNRDGFRPTLGTSAGVDLTLWIFTARAELVNQVQTLRGYDPWALLRLTGGLRFPKGWQHGPAP